MDKITATVEAAEEEILNLELRTATIKQRIVTLEQNKEDATYLRAPIRYIPAEIIARVLFFALELHVKPLGPSGRVHFANLRCISSIWRGAAFATPQLWRSSEVDISA